MKYSPAFPERFESIEHARAFCTEFFDAYNYHMYHSGLAMLTPAMVHHAAADLVIRNRQKVLTSAFSAHPERFVNGSPKHHLVPDSVWVNKPVEDLKEVLNF